MFVKASFRKKLLVLSIAAVVVSLQVGTSFADVNPSNGSAQVHKALHDRAVEAQKQERMARERADKLSESRVIDKGTKWFKDLADFEAKKKKFANDLVAEISADPGLQAEKKFLETVTQVNAQAKVASKIKDVLAVTGASKLADPLSNPQLLQAFEQLTQAKAELKNQKLDELGLRQADAAARADAEQRAKAKWLSDEEAAKVKKNIEEDIAASTTLKSLREQLDDAARVVSHSKMIGISEAIAKAEIDERKRVEELWAKKVADAIEADIREDLVVKEVGQQIAKVNSDFSEDNLAELAGMDMETWLTSRTQTGARAKAELDAAKALNQLLKGDLDELTLREKEILAAALKQHEDAEKAGVVTLNETGEAVVETINDESAEINAELGKIVAQLELMLQQALAEKKAAEVAAKIAADDQQASANVAQLTGNARAAGQAFVAAVQSGQIDRNDEIYQVFTDGSAEQVARLAGQLAPEVNGGVAQAAQTGHSLIAQATGSRTSTLRSGISSGETPMETGAWVQVLNSDANQGARQGVAGYKANSQGIAVGADGKLNEQVTLGVAYSHLGTEVKSDQGNKTDVTGHALTAYGSYEQDGYFVDGSLTFGQNANESTRQILDDRAKANYDSRLFGANVLAGYGFQLDNGVLVEPRVAGRYSHVSINGYQEKGSSAALSVKGQTVEVMELGAGVRVAGQFPLKQGTLEPEVKLMAYHDFKADRASSTSAFVQGGTPFVTDGAKPTSNSIEAGVGLNYRTGASTFGVSYDYLSKKDFDADSVQLKARYDF
ncbi:autotransporter outer membrane beta-barrel domain-containing protein [Pseudomonas batumici]|uniref:autotransporter outer membrane beta-barrel domain-containing protein n=1 Tax=Pseudomonas batumici TaxID=226910 RepID=UPI0030D06E16